MNHYKRGLAFLVNLILTIAGVIGCILLCQAAGIIGVLTTDTGNSPWFQSLAKPSFNPPGWVFGPVWTLLYTLMGISLYLLARQWPASRTAFIIFVIQLILNAAWTPVFFGMHQMRAALVIIVLLWATILATTVAAWPVSGVSAGLLVPYLLWVSFAAVLNASFVSLNR